MTEDVVIRPHPATDLIAPGDTPHLLRGSHGGVLIQGFHNRLHFSDAVKPRPKTITYVNLRNAIYRTFVLQGDRPTVAEQQRIRDQITSDGFEVRQYALRPMPSGPSTRAVARRSQSPRRFNLWSTLATRAARFVYPTLSAQDTGCWGYFATGNGVVDPADIELATIYPELDFGVDDFDSWYAYGDVTYGTYHGVTNWYLSSFDGFGDGVPYWGAGWTDSEMTFYNTDFPGNPPPVPVYVSLYGYIGYDSGWIDPEGAWATWGAPSYTLLSNYPTGWFGNGYDGCYYGF